MIPTGDHETSCCDRCTAVGPRGVGGGGRDTLAITDTQIPSPSTGSRIFVENMYLVSTFSFILGRFGKLPTLLSNVANLKNMIHLVNFYCFEGVLILKHNLISPRTIFGERIQAKARQETQLGTELQVLPRSRIPDEFFNTVQKF